MLDDRNKNQTQPNVQNKKKNLKSSESSFDEAPSTPKPYSYIEKLISDIF
jgi:hypothetical protein